MGNTSSHSLIHSSTPQIPTTSWSGLEPKVGARDLIQVSHTGHRSLLFGLSLLPPWTELAGWHTQELSQAMKPGILIRVSIGVLSTIWNVCHLCISLGQNPSKRLFKLMLTKFLPSHADSSQALAFASLPELFLWKSPRLTGLGIFFQSPWHTFLTWPLGYSALLVSLEVPPQAALLVILLPLLVNNERLQICLCFLSFPHHSLLYACNSWLLSPALIFFIVFAP